MNQFWTQCSAKVHSPCKMEAQFIEESAISWVCELGFPMGVVVFEPLERSDFLGRGTRSTIPKEQFGQRYRCPKLHGDPFLGSIGMVNPRHDLFLTQRASLIQPLATSQPSMKSEDRIRGMSGCAGRRAFC